MNGRRLGFELRKKMMKNGLHASKPLIIIIITTTTLIRLIFINITNQQNIYVSCNKMKKPIKLTIFFINILGLSFFFIICLSLPLPWFFSFHHLFLFFFCIVLKIFLFTLPFHLSFMQFFFSFPSSFSILFLSIVIFYYSVKNCYLVQNRVPNIKDCEKIVGILNCQI